MFSPSLDDFFLVNEGHLFDFFSSSYLRDFLGGLLAVLEVFFPGISPISDLWSTSPESSTLTSIIFIVPSGSTNRTNFIIFCAAPAPASIFICS